MNFTSKIKEEIILSKQPDVRAFLSGFIRATGSIIVKKGQYGFLLATDNGNVFNYIFSIIKDTYGIEGVAEREEDSLNKKERYYLSYTGGKAMAVLSDLQILDGKNKSIVLNGIEEGDMLTSVDSKRSFIEGTFLGAGACTIPTDVTSKKTSFHLEVVFPHHDSAQAFSEMLSCFDIFASLTARRDYYIVYVKSFEQITDFLVVLNVPMALNEIIQKKAQRDANNTANRQVNCDIANMDKQLRTSEKQIRAIKLIESTIGLDSLSVELKETALLRKKYAEESLSDLAKRSGVTKSGLNHRLKKLVGIADNLQN